MEVELWERLMYHAPHQRRSAGNLLQKLVAEGLDRLDAEERRDELAENAQELLALIPAERMKEALAWQKDLLQRLKKGTPRRPLLPDPPPMEPALRRGRKPRKPPR